MVNIKCCWEGCEEESDYKITGLCPWGIFTYCIKHDKELHDQVAKLLKDSQEDIEEF